MGEPRPPSGAPLLLFVLSLVGSGGGQPLTRIPWGTILHTPKVEVAFAAPGLETHLHHRWLQKAMGRGSKRLAEEAGRAQKEESRLSLARPTFQEEKDPLKPIRRTLLNQPGNASEVPGHRSATKSGAQPPLPIVATEAGAAHEPGCRCPHSQRATVAARALQAGQGALRVPTPRTEEAAWAASALTFLLVLLTLAVLYTRLHRKCRRGPSLYWMTGGEEGHETVAAVMKRRLFSRQRRAKRSRQPLQQPRMLPPGSSSDDSSSA